MYRFFISSIAILPLLALQVSCSSNPTLVESPRVDESPLETVEAVATKKSRPKGSANQKQGSKPRLIAGKYRVKSEQRGLMSWYSVKTNGGTETASGERFKNEGLTAAHRKLSFGTRVRVTNLRNGKSEIVRITDRGPFIKKRIIDVSIGTARRLGFVDAGVVKCKVEVLKKATDAKAES